MRALVTGATGFLGGRLVRQLLARGFDVRCVVRGGGDPGALGGGAGPGGGGRPELVRGSLARVDEWAGAFDGCDVVFHLAAAMAGSTAVLFASNVIATREVAAAAARSGVWRFVLASSLAVYGTAGLRPGSVVDESCPLDPEPERRDPYTYSKVVQEEVARSTGRECGLPLVVVRPGVIYGPGRDCITGRVGLRLGNFLVRMGGRQRLPYTHVENCAHAVLLAGTVPGVEGEAFNVVDDDPPTARQLVRRYRSEVRRLRVLPVPHAAIGPVSRLCEGYHRWSRGQLPAVLTLYKSRSMWTPLNYSNAKAKAALGWSPQVGFPEGLRETFQSLRAAGGPNGGEV